MSVNGIDEASGPEADPDLDLSYGTFDLTSPGLTAVVGRRAPDGTVVELEVCYAEVDGNAIYQGDIRLGEAGAIAERERRRRSPYLGLVITSAGDLWKDGIVPFKTDAGAASVVAKAAARLAASTNVRMRPHAGEESYVRFVTGRANHSAVGRQGGEQIISLKADVSTGTALHEICHALGLWHEHCRPDRDEHITIVRENVLAGCMPQFAIQDTDAATTGSYDYGSIMHYGPAEFSDPAGATTIRTKGGATIGQRNGLSAGDVSALRSLYP